MPNFHRTARLFVGYPGRLPRCSLLLLTLLACTQNDLPYQAPDTGTGSSDHDTDTGGDTAGDTAADRTIWCRTLMKEAVSEAQVDVLLVVVDMATGAWVEEERWSRVSFTPVFYTLGLATDGDDWAFAGMTEYPGTVQWFTVDAVSGVVSSGAETDRLGDGNPTRTVGWSGDEWVSSHYSRDGGIERFDTLRELRANTPTQTTPGDYDIRVLAVHDGKVYGPGPYGGESLQVVDLQSGRRYDDIPLQDGRLSPGHAGISFAGGYIYISAGDSIAWFTPRGYFIGVVSLEDKGDASPAGGLSCSTRPTEAR